MISSAALTYPEILSAAAALAICFAAGLVGHLTARFAGPYLARAWIHIAGARAEGVSDRMCELIRYAAVALLLAISIEADDWPDLSELVLGLSLAASAALFVLRLVDSLHLPRTVAWVLASLSFLGIFADVIDGLDPAMEILNRIGFDAGSKRLSLLTVLQVAIGLLILIVALRVISRIVNHSIRRSQRLDPTQQLLAEKLVGVGLLVVAFFIGIDIVGIDLTALAVFSGAFGLAVGFGLQKTFGNLIAGIILLMDRSIKPGDVIAVGESFGHVSKIGVRAVSIVTRDGKEHLIPNENLMTQEVENWSYSSTNVRVHIPVGVGYDCDLPLAQRLMVEAAKTPSRVLRTPEPTVWLRAFGESSVDHDILVWISDPEGGVGNVQSEILNRLWALFKENGIQIPFPQRDIRVKEWPGPPSN